MDVVDSLLIKGMRIDDTEIKNTSNKRQIEMPMTFVIPFGNGLVS